MLITGAVLVGGLGSALEAASADTALSGLAFAVSVLRAARSGGAAAALGAPVADAAVSELTLAVSAFRAARSDGAAFSAPLIGAAVPRSSSSVGLSRSSVWSAVFARGGSSAETALLSGLA